MILKRKGKAVFLFIFLIVMICACGRQREKEQGNKYAVYYVNYDETRSEERRVGKECYS